MSFGEFGLVGWCSRGLWRPCAAGGGERDRCGSAGAEFRERSHARGNRARVSVTPGVSSVLGRSPHCPRCPMAPFSAQEASLSHSMLERARK